MWTCKFGKNENYILKIKSDEKNNNVHIYSL